MKLMYWRLIPFIVFALLLLFLWRGLSLDPQKLPSAQLGQSLPIFKVPTLNDPDRFLTQEQFTGKFTLLNIWASWCAACVEEQAFLLKLSSEGIPIIGLNYKDKNDKANQWLADWGNPYQLIGQDISGKVAIDLGVYGAPETFLIDSQGIIRFRHVGILDEESWKNDFLPRIKIIE